MRQPDLRPAPRRRCGPPPGEGDGDGVRPGRTAGALWGWTSEGDLPVVIDASSCVLGLKSEVVENLTEENRERHGKLEILDSVAWAQRLLPNLQIKEKLGSVAVHPTCSTRHLGLERELRAIAGEMANEVVQPVRATCCGMAGDRGLLHPELTASATAEEAAELSGTQHDAYLCSNRTCEIGLQQATGAAYESFLIPLERVSRE